MKTFLTLLFAVVVLPSAAPAADEYQVQFNHPMKAGQKYTLSASFLQKRGRKIMAGTKVMKAQVEKLDVMVQGTVTVEKVDQRGRPVAAVLTVDSFIRKQGQRQSVLFHKGTVIKAFNAGAEKAFTVNGELVSPEVHKALSAILQIGPEQTSQNERFAPNKPKKVGETWKADSRRLVEELADRGVKVAPEKVTGVFRLKAIKAGKDGNAMIVTGTIAVNDVDLQLAAGSTVVESELKTDLRHEISLDDQHSARTTRSSRFRVLAVTPKQKDGAAISIEVMRVEELQTTRKPL